MASTRTSAVRAVRSLRGLDPTRLVEEVVQDYRRNELLIYASAIAFRVLTSLPPFLLFAFALMGALDLENVWRDDVAPHIRDSVSSAGFEVIDNTVTNVFNSKQTFWMSAGLGLAIWQVSSAVRAVMAALNRIYDVRKDRDPRERLLVSLALAVPVAGCLLLAVAVVLLGPLVYGDVGQPLGVLLVLVRWGIAGGLCLVTVWLLLRFAPAKRRPVVWVSVGTSLVIALWLGMSLGFGTYLRFIASYGSVFGALATMVVATAYIYLSCVVFLAGAMADSEMREQMGSRV